MVARTTVLPRTRLGTQLPAERVIRLRRSIRRLLLRALPLPRIQVPATRPPAIRLRITRLLRHRIIRRRPSDLRLPEVAEAGLTVEVEQAGLTAEVTRAVGVAAAVRRAAVAADIAADRDSDSIPSLRARSIGFVFRTGPLFCIFSASLTFNIMYVIGTGTWAALASRHWVLWNQ